MVSARASSAVVRRLTECAEQSLGAPGASVRTSLDKASGCPRLVQRQLRLLPGAQAVVPAGGAGELWYVACGSASLGAHDGSTRTLTEGSALLLPPGAYPIAAGDAGPLEVVIVTLPSDGEPPVAAVVEAHFQSSPEERTGDRTFRVLIGGHLGFSRATQFVGSIPPSRAPFHTHTYDEVVMVLQGHGLVHVDNETTELAPGTCVYLPPGSEHCLENDGDETLRVLGVFSPGGTPAAKREVAAPRGAVAPDQSGG